ncbi:Clan CA, family C19, ubiquitin hydrolase-like cysteine peptidase [Histomonas meleagridis]|uniref:Clan CA, family C19, ubiquitin hydrolase-like cysteine peptidase n=1 Tax=Histomonas meleagridis TaxID=135588 RepID=UPI00355A4EBB|nr:Clan CA, family C19, ubiquitin hydrolase-like cysteine peptidase [Histomonas meleagridis]KAH0800405.1 Clan CA, family C19, ubiquitin hydrolase-like cysteine peptidase [Histomonas meleagridis]
MEEKIKQYEEIQNLMQTEEISVGDGAYIIDKNWIQKWRNTFGFINEPETETPIDNSKIMENGKIKEDSEYEIIPKKVWEDFVLYYGGGPEIHCNVEFDPVRNRNIPIVQPPEYEVTFEDKKHTFTYELFKPTKEFKDAVCSFFNCDPNIYHLYDYYHSVKQERIYEDKSFGYYYLNDQCSLILSKETNSEVKIISKDETQTEVGTICGIFNMGNTCYMSASLQCLCRIPSIERFFLSNDFTNRVNVLSPTKGRISSAFSEIIRYLHDPSFNNIAPRLFKCVFGDYSPQFANRNQQDAHEFITILLDLLHQELKSNDDGTSIISDTFQGSNQSHIFCPECNHESITQEPFTSLTLPVPIPMVTTPPFLFVPYDITSPRIMMTLSVISSYTIGDIIDALSQYFGREVNIVIAEQLETSTNLMWRTKLIKTMSENKLIVFEIPRDSTSNIFAPVRLLTTCNGKTYDVDSFYLVGIPNEDSNFETIISSCEERFKPFFLTDDKTFNDNKVKTLYKKVENEEVNDEPNVYIRNPPRLRRNMDIFKVSERTIDVILNSYSMKKCFNWSYVHNVISIINKKATKSKTMKKVSINECIDLFKQNEVLSSDNLWFCPNCKKYVAASKKFEISKFGEILIIHFKRFLYTKYSNRKIDISIDFPNEIELPMAVNDEHDHMRHFSLMGVINHVGGLEGGHYTANIKDSKSNKWFKCNDDRVSKISSENVRSSNAYILFYQLDHDK